MVLSYLASVMQFLSAMVPAENLGIAFRIIVAAILGGLIGFEREQDGEPAGIRTHTLVAVAAAAFTIISMGFDNNPDRIAAGIVTGIGFLGAGTIFKSHDQVKGLTTAAALWCAAAAGLAVGIEQYFLASIITVIVFFVLISKKIFPALGKKEK